MTTAQAKTQPLEAAYSHIKDFNEQMLDATRKAVTQYVDTYAKAVDRAIDAERKLADATKQEWLKSIIEAQADITKDLNDAYASSVHSLFS